MAYPQRLYGSAWKWFEGGVKFISMNSDPFKQYLCQEYSPLLFWFYSLMCLFMTLFRALCTHFYRSIILIARRQVVVNLCNPSDKKSALVQQDWSKILLPLYLSPVLISIHWKGCRIHSTTYMICTVLNPSIVMGLFLWTPKRSLQELIQSKK